MAHRFRLRQLVRLLGAAGVWEVVRLLPEDQTGEPSYRVVSGLVERAVRESEVEAA